MTNKRFTTFGLFLALLACVLFAQALVLHAQLLATFSVTITDPTGSVVPDAQVTLTSEDTGLVRTQLTDRAGLAVLTALNAGNYHLEVKADGVNGYEQPLTISVGQVASIAVQLGIAAVKQSVSVSESSATAVETDKTETSQVIRPNQIAD